MSKIVCDSSSLISLSNNCISGVIPFFSEKHDTEFIIPKGVKKEIIDKPLQTKRYKFIGLKMKGLVEEGYLEILEDETVKDYTDRFLELGNSLLVPEDREPIEVIHRGETEAIGLLKHLGTNNLLIDERTTRLLIEDIDILKDYISTETKEEIKINEETKEKIELETKDIDVIRSSELVSRAYELDYFKKKSKDLLEGSLYGLKFAGCAIKNEEIEEYLELID